MSSFEDYEEPIEYSETQKRWHKFYEDKQWIDTKGWCDMNGNPLPFGHDEVVKKSKLKINGSSDENDIDKGLFIQIIITVIALIGFAVFLFLQFFI